MPIDTGGWLIAGTGAASATQPALKSAERPPFLLEGARDVYQALPDRSRLADEGGPVYPSLGRRLYPALDALQETVQQLGKHPGPGDVDRSNVRRLLRSMMPVLEAHRSSYRVKDYDRAHDELQQLVRSVGRYKDVDVLERTLRSLYPDGRLPARMESQLGKTQTHEAERFHQSFRHFRKHGLADVTRWLTRPRALDGMSPREIERADREMLAKHLQDLVDDVHRVGLGAEDPEPFHAGRKSLRRVIMGVRATRDVFPVAEPDLDAMAHLVDGLGVAQDSYIALIWLRTHGFTADAARMASTYRERHDAEVVEARRLAASDVLPRVRRQVAAEPS